MPMAETMDGEIQRMLRLHSKWPGTSIWEQARRYMAARLAPRLPANR